MIIHEVSMKLSEKFRIHTLYVGQYNVLQRHQAEEVALAHGQADSKPEFQCTNQWGYNIHQPTVYLTLTVFQFTKYLKCFILSQLLR